MKTYNTIIKDICLDIIRQRGTSIFWQIDEFEEAINSYSLDYYEECYEIIQALKIHLLDLLILNRHIPFDEVVNLVRSDEISENEAVFMTTMISQIVEAIDWEVEIVNFSDVIEQAHENESIKELRTLALAYFDGVGVPQDYEKAYRLFKELEYIGDDESYYYLGLMSEQGLGVETDQDKAMSYYEQGASLNENECLFALGRIAYDKGEFDKAEEALSESEDPRAYALLGEIYNKKEMYIDAYRLFVKGAKTYEPRSLDHLGRYYQFGLAVSKDMEKAIKYFSYAYYQGVEEATLSLAHIYATGAGAPVNVKFAHDLYEQYHRMNEVNNEDI